MVTTDRQVSPPCLLVMRGRAVVIEQDPKDLKVYTEILQRLGFEVRTFAHHQEAFPYLEREIPDFVLVNQGSRDFESREVVKRVLARNRHTPVVVLTRILDMGCYFEAMQLGAVDYVEKPLPPGEVEHLVTTHSRPRRRVGSTAA